MSTHAEALAGITTILAIILTVINFLGSLASIESSNLIPAVLLKVNGWCLYVLTQLQQAANINIIELILIILTTSILSVLYERILSRKRSEESHHLNEFIKQMDQKPIDGSVCGLYFGIRKMAPQNPRVQEELYYAQYLVISQPSKNEFQFVMFGSWDDGKFYIKGSCVRIDKHLILCGATNSNRDTFQIAMLRYPVVLTKETQLKGMLSLTRVDLTDSVATRISFKKLKSLNDISERPAEIIEKLFLEDFSAIHARDYSLDELIKSVELKGILGAGDFDKMYKYINEEQINNGITHS